MEEWINNYYDNIITFFKIKKKLPLVLVEDSQHFGKCRSVKYTIGKVDTINHTYKIFETGWQNIEIQLSKEWVGISYQNQKEYLFPFVIRTLIHELVHQKGYILHSKKFKRMERRMFIKWIANKLNISEKDVLEDKELMDYIFRFDLR